MKKLVFNTTEKKVTLYSDMNETSMILSVSDTPTVKVCPEGFYEVMVTYEKIGGMASVMPRVRIPINEVIMFIEQ
jgi:hypothetical protein